MANKKVVKNRDGAVNSDDWKTPGYIYEPLDAVFKFDYDPCPLNYKVDGLDDDIPWGKSNFINPPYNRFDKPKFIKRVFKEWQINDSTNVLLVPASTGTRQFHSLILPGAKVVSFNAWLKNWEGLMMFNKILIFMEGRIAFEGYNTKGEFTTTGKGKHDSMIVILK